METQGDTVLKDLKSLILHVDVIKSMLMVKTVRYISTLGFMGEQVITPE